MSDLEIRTTGGIATVSLARGKVNALSEALVDELGAAFAMLAADPTVRAAILTGRGKFFSFGLDTSEVLSWRRDRFGAFLAKFTRLYREMFLFPKPLVGAVNGHATAGGCMLALACDRRIMAEGKGRIALNEIAFGASLFAGSVEMLRHAVGSRNAERIALTGDFFDATSAMALGLVDEVCPGEELPEKALETARSLAAKHPDAYRGVKALLRGPAGEAMARSEAASIPAFLDVWYSEETQRNLRNIRIRD